MHILPTYAERRSARQTRNNNRIKMQILESRIDLRIRPEKSPPSPYFHLHFPLSLTALPTENQFTPLKLFPVLVHLALHIRHKQPATRDGGETITRRVFLHISMSSYLLRHSAYCPPFALQQTPPWLLCLVLIYSLQRPPIRFSIWKDKEKLTHKPLNYRFDRAPDPPHSSLFLYDMLMAPFELSLYYVSGPPACHQTRTILAPDSV